MTKGVANPACDLNAVGTKLQVEKPQRSLLHSASLPPTRSSVSTSFGGTRESPWSEFSSRSDEFSSPLVSRCFSPSSISSFQITGSFEVRSVNDSLDGAERNRRNARDEATDSKNSKRSVSRSQNRSPSSGPLPKPRRPSKIATLPPMQNLQLSLDLDVVGASFGWAPHGRRWSRSGNGTSQRSSVGSAPFAWQEPFLDSQDQRSAESEREKLQKSVPLMTWLREMGVDVELSGLQVQGRSAMSHSRHQPMNHSQRARLDRAFMEQLDRITQERGLPLEDLTQDLQIFRLKLHSRQARRRLHDIFGAKRRRAPPPPEFVKVVPVQEDVVLKVKEPAQPSSITDDYIPRTPKAVVAVEVPQIKEDPVVVPTTPATPISRRPTPQKPPQEEVEEPIPVVVPRVELEEEEELPEEIARPPPKVPTLPSTPTVQPKAKPRQELPEVKPPTPPVREEIVVEPRGLFKIKESMQDPKAALLFPQRRPTKEKKSKEVTLRDDDWFQEESEKPQSSQGHSRPVSRRRFNLAEQFREALALAWQRALQSLEDQRSFPDLKEREEKDDEDEQSSDKELMETFTSLFSDTESTESLSLSESAKRLQRRRYRKGLLRRTRSNQVREKTARCWTNRMEVCQRLLQSVDVLAAKGTSSPC